MESNDKKKQSKSKTSRSSNNLPDTTKNATKKRSGKKVKRKRVLTKSSTKGSKAKSSSRKKSSFKRKKQPTSKKRCNGQRSTTRVRKEVQQQRRQEDYDDDDDEDEVEGDTLKFVSKGAPLFPGRDLNTLTEEEKLDREKYMKRGTVGSQVHPLKFALHGHNRHVILKELVNDEEKGNDHADSPTLKLFTNALSKGYSGTIDTFLIECGKDASLARNPELFQQMETIARAKLREILEKDSQAFPPTLAIIDDGTTDSVRKAHDIQRASMSVEGVTMLSPWKNYFNRHEISPETPSREMAKRMTEGVMDAVDIDIQDIGHVNRAAGVEKKTKKAIKKAIIEIRNAARVAGEPISDTIIREKVSPLLQVLENNQHPGIRSNVDHFSQVMNKIKKKERSTTIMRDRIGDEYHPSEAEQGKGKDMKTVKREVDERISEVMVEIKREQGVHINPSDEATTRRSLFRAGISFVEEDEVVSDDQIRQTINKIPITMVDASTGKALILGEEVLPGVDGMGPVPLKKFPFKSKGETKEHTRLMRAIRKMYKETVIIPEEYESFFQQVMAPEETFLESLFNVACVSRNPDEMPVNRLRQPTRRIKDSEANKRKGTSVSKALERTLSNIKQGKVNEYEEEGKKQKAQEELDANDSYVREILEKDKAETLEDKDIMSPQLPDYRYETEEEEIPSMVVDKILERRSCIMKLIKDQNKRKREIEWMVNAFKHDNASIEEIFKNPSLYSGAGGDGLMGLGEPCSREYISDFLRIPVGTERECVNGKNCIGLKIPSMSGSWPETRDITIPDGIKLREFFRPEQLRKIQNSQVYPEKVNPCVLCIDYLTTSACFSFASSETSPGCIIQYYWVKTDPEKGYSKRRLLPNWNGKNHTFTGIVLSAKMFLAHKYLLDTVLVFIGDKYVPVRCYKEVINDDDDIGSGGIDGTTLQTTPTIQKDF